MSESRIYIRFFPWSLAILVVVSGLVTMSLEFSVGRILIPVFGDSVITWGSLIGVILSGLSLGYHLGGRFADKKDASFLKFCSIMFSAGLYIVLIPFLAPIIMGFSTSLFVSNSSYASPLFATFMLLTTPTILLGIITPYAVKLATNKVSIVGKMAGNLYSLSTIGSIIGTFLTVFVLIPVFEIRYILFALGLTLILSSLIGLGRIFPKILAVSVVVILFSPTTSLILALASHSGALIYENETPYSHLDVTDLGNIRTLYLNGMTHSQMYKDRPNDLVITYTKYFQLGFLFNPDAKNILFVGGGGFSGPKYFLNSYVNTTIDVVEIDRNVIDAAKNYFNLSEGNPRLRVFNDDARNFLSKIDKKYDIIILDAFSKNYVPFHLMTLEYFESLKRKLNPNGVIISNLIGSGTGDTSDLFRAVYKTMSEAYPVLYVFPTNDEGFVTIQNVILVATNTDIEYTKFELQKIALDSNINNRFFTKSIITYFFEHLYEQEIRTNDVPLLTDQFAPVENLLNPITGKTYVIDEQTNKGIGLIWTESSMVSVAILTIICTLWIAYNVGIWKRQKIPS